MNNEIQKIKILLITADTKNSIQETEFYNAILSGLEKAEKSEYFELKAKFSSNISDFYKEFEKYKPHILHLVGHGDNLEQFVFEDTKGANLSVKTEYLADLIGESKDTLHCVNISACNSEELATSITRYIPYAVYCDDYLNISDAIIYTEEFFFFIAQGNTFDIAAKKAYKILQSQKIYKTIPSLKSMPNLINHRNIFQLCSIIQKSLKKDGNSNLKIKHTNNIHNSNEPLNDTFALSIRKHMEKLQKKIEKLTEEQCRIIKYLHGNRRVKISGCAGSGKTLIAAQKAILLSEAGLSVLCLCHNPLLKGFLENLTSGHRIDIKTFTEWVRQLNKDAYTTTEDMWTHFHEPSEEEINSAQNILSQGIQYYDAIIVDEGQDFRDEWWKLVESGLKNGKDGIIYIFQDDYQALLSGRATYKNIQAELNLSRNCRNAGKIYDVVRMIRPDIPLPEKVLLQTGQVLCCDFQSGNEILAIQKSIKWLNSLNYSKKPIVLLAGTVTFENSPFNKENFQVLSDSRWKKVVVDEFTKISEGHHISAKIADVKKEELHQYLSRLSNEVVPSKEDVNIVHSAAQLFEIPDKKRRQILKNPNLKRGMSWKLKNGQLCLGRSSFAPIWAAEIIMHFERDDWHKGIPMPTSTSISFAKYDNIVSNDTIPVYQVSDFKGLEAESILLFVLGKSPSLMTELYVGISRARFQIALVVENSILSNLRIKAGEYFDEYK